MTTNQKKLLISAIVLIGAYFVLCLGINAAFKYSFSNYVDNDPDFPFDNKTCVIDTVSSVFNTFEKAGFLINGKFKPTDKMKDKIMTVALTCELGF